jgi:hypothetical protein
MSLHAISQHPPIAAECTWICYALRKSTLECVLIFSAVLNLNPAS